MLAGVGQVTQIGSTYAMFFRARARLRMSCVVRALMMIGVPKVVPVGIVPTMMGLVGPGLPVFWGSSLQFCNVRVLQFPGEDVVHVCVRDRAGRGRGRSPNEDDQARGEAHVGGDFRFRFRLSGRGGEA